MKVFELLLFIMDNLTPIVWKRLKPPTELIFYKVHSLKVLLWPSCHYKTVQTGWCKQQTLCPHRSGGDKSRVNCQHLVPVRALPGLQMGAFSQGFHITSPLCLLRAALVSLPLRHQPHGSGSYPQMQSHSKYMEAKTSEYKFGTWTQCTS